jgi:hypothetical protein
MLSGDVCERHERTLVKVKICVARQCNRVKIDETLLPTAASTSNKECTRGRLHCLLLLHKSCVHQHDALGPAVEPRKGK